MEYQISNIMGTEFDGSKMCEITQVGSGNRFSALVKKVYDKKAGISVCPINNSHSNFTGAPFLCSLKNGSSFDKMNVGDILISIY